MGLNGDPCMTPFQLHVMQYGSGCGHYQCSIGGTKVCLVRGKIPADVLFIGEAPGESENTFGVPFWGQAGRLLDDIIAKGVHRDYPEIRVAITNLVGCIPRVTEGEESGKGKAKLYDEPDDRQIKQCSARLLDFVSIAEPRLIVTIGKLARNWLSVGMKDTIDVDRNIPRIDIIHPAAILKLPSNLRNLKVQESIVTLNNAVEELECPF